MISVNDFLAFSDEENKLESPPHNPSMFITLWNVKEPIHYSTKSSTWSFQCCDLFSVIGGGGGGMLRYISYTKLLKNLRVNKAYTILTMIIILYEKWWRAKYQNY